MTQLGYARTPFVRGLVNNSTATAFPDTGAGPIATATKPSTVDESSLATGNCIVVDCSMEFADLEFFGADGDNDTFDVRLILWRRAVRPNNASFAVTWIPTRISDLNIVLGAKTGVAGGAVKNTEFFADTITAVASGNTDRVVVYSPTGDGNGTVKVRTDGFEKLGIYFDLAGAQAGVSMNALIGFH